MLQARRQLLHTVLVRAVIVHVRAPSGQKTAARGSLRLAFDGSTWLCSFLDTSNPNPKGLRSTEHKALQLPQAFFPCHEKETRISTNKHGDRQALILVLYRFSMFLLLRPRIVDATAKLVYGHSTGAWVVYPGTPPAHTSPWRYFMQ